MRFWQELIASILVVSVSAGAAMSQGLPVLEPKAQPKPLDKLRNAAEVGVTRIVVGVMVDTERLPPSEPRLMAEIPKTWFGDAICVRLVSEDALYEGRAEYDYNIPLNAADRLTPIRSPISDEHWKILKKRYNGWLAAIVTKDGCEKHSTEVVLAAWGAPPSKNGVMNLLINSQGATEVTAEIVDPPAYGKIRCESSAATGGVGYDAICRTKLEDLPDVEKLEIRVERINFGAFEKPVTLKLHRAIQ